MILIMSKIKHKTNKSQTSLGKEENIRKKDAKI